jgi:hypothetical protein
MHFFLAFFVRKSDNAERRFYMAKKAVNSSSKKKKKPGRPPEDIFEKYNICIHRLEKIAALGATDAFLADLYGVGEATIRDWKVKFDNFSAALKRGKDKADAAVVKSLYRRALGYAFNEVTTEHIKIGEEESPAQKVKTVRKQIHPDTTAQIFWLKNRLPEEWRDRMHHQHEGSISIIDAIKKQAKSNPEVEKSLEQKLED